MRYFLLAAMVLIATAVGACGEDGERPDAGMSPAPSPWVSPTAAAPVTPRVSPTAAAPVTPRVSPTAAAPATPRVSPTAAVTATPLPPPAKPASFEGFDDAIAAYLAAGGGSPDCLAQLLEAWERPDDGTTPCVAADMDGDGDNEYVVRLARKSSQSVSPLGIEGTVIILAEKDGRYSVIFRLRDLAITGLPDSGAWFADPAIFDVDDFNGDGREEAALTSTECGARTCSVTLCVVGIAAGGYGDLTQPPEGAGDCLTAASAVDQVQFRDVNGDGVSELLFGEGTIDAVGAGPQREAVHTYRWDGSRYVLDGTEYAASELRYFMVRDGDAAFAAGDFEAAAAHYREAVESPAALDVDSFGDPEELKAYARFRWGYGMRERVSSGCLAARVFIEANIDAFAAVWEYGYANPPFDPDALCPS